MRVQFTPPLFPAHLLCHLLLCSFSPSYFSHFPTEEIDHILVIKSKVISLLYNPFLYYIFKSWNIEESMPAHSFFLLFPQPYLLLHCPSLPGLLLGFLFFPSSPKWGGARTHCFLIIVLLTLSPLTSLLNIRISVTGLPTCHSNSDLVCCDSQLSHRNLRLNIVKGFLCLSSPALLSAYPICVKATIIL